MKIRETLIRALLSNYEGEMAKAKANIEIYLKNPMGIGDHSDIISAIDEQVSNYAAANEKWDIVSDIFDENSGESDDWD